MHTVLFIFYSLVCGFAICRMPFIRKSGIRRPLLLGLFGLHVFTGLAHNIIAYRYYPEHGDVWDFFWESFQYRHLLVADFPNFLSNNSTWTYLSHNGVVFIQMFLNLFSNDHQDVNTLLFSFPVFLGNIALFRTFRYRFPDDPLTAFMVFLLPSLLFWTSCIHREGVIYMLLGFLLLGLHGMMTGAFTTSRLLRFLGCFLLIVYFRIGFAITLIPAIFLWVYHEKPANRPALRMIALVSMGTAIALVIFVPGLHVPQAAAHWQNEFYQLKGHSRLALPALDGSWASLIRVLPDAALDGFFQPLPGSGGQPIYLAFSIELLIIWIIAAVALTRKFRSHASHAIAPFTVFCLFFSLTGMLLIGMFVPFAGTIIRYRCIYLLFLLAPSLHMLASIRPLRSINNSLFDHAFYKL